MFADAQSQWIRIREKGKTMTKVTRRQFFEMGAAGAAASMLDTPKTGDAAARARSPKNVLLIMADQHAPFALGINGDAVALPLQDAGALFQRCRLYHIGDWQDAL